MRKLFLSERNKVIAGVCGGIGEYFNVDPTLVRLAWAAFTVLSLGAGIILYLIAWLIIPEKNKPSVLDRVSREARKK
jgi:phage shock protein PspC (stress-responsive transcriptional regulator)